MDIINQIGGSSAGEPGTSAVGQGNGSKFYD